MEKDRKTESDSRPTTSLLSATRSRQSESASPRSRRDERHEGLHPLGPSSGYVRSRQCVGAGEGEAEPG